MRLHSEEGGRRWYAWFQAQLTLDEPQPMYVPGISEPLSPSLEAIIFLEPIDMALNTGIADT